ncbi:hypothetical protein C1I60_01650 [Paenibacillus terrae]|uniref:Uncharacterized protein n=1 Tax=Paenibacillus terrae TaxID=159743 RepID=A0A4V5SR83_9BACL|nr:hypothetical protein C1I60_01650 [Paenibacillus terrae]
MLNLQINGHSLVYLDSAASRQKPINAFSVGSHASTFGGSPLATSAGIATLEVLPEERLFKYAEQMGQSIVAKLSALLKKRCWSIGYTWYGIVNWY